MERVAEVEGHSTKIRRRPSKAPLTIHGGALTGAAILGWERDLVGARILAALRRPATSPSTIEISASEARHDDRLE